jgi:hypothetical protein
MEFLLDDSLIDRSAGVVPALGRWTKQSEPILKPEMPWEMGGISARHALLFDDGVYKLWYGASGAEDAVAAKDATPEDGEQQRLLCCVHSRDGIHWERPELDLFEYKGNCANNIIGTKSNADGVTWNVVKDLDDPDPARRYKALGFDYCTTTQVPGTVGEMGVCVAFSPDGYAWTSPHMVVSTHDSTDADCLLPERDSDTGLWTLFIRPRTHPKRRFIAISTSDDFENWTSPQIILTPDSNDDEWTEFYGLTMTCVESLRIGCLWVYHNNPDYSPMTNELVFSRDGKRYTRALPGEQFLPLGHDGEFDSRMVIPIRMIEHDGEIRLYYQGLNHEHGSDRRMKMPKGRVVPGEESVRYVGLASLPWGHFRGLRAHLDGMVETSWVCNYGDVGVSAIADIETGGWVRAEILDQYGVVIPGFDRVSCVASTGDDGRLRFTWGESLVGRHGDTSDEGGKIGHVVKLRFHLHCATLFGFEVG